MSLIKRDRKTRNKQVNVRLNPVDSMKFNEIMEASEHQSVSELVRDLIRIGHQQLKTYSQDKINTVLANLPPYEGGSTTGSQLNVRLTDDELTKLEWLMKSMQSRSVSKCVRNLIAIYHTPLEEQATAQQTG